MVYDFVIDRGRFDPHTMNCDLCILLSYMLRMLCQYDSKLGEQYGVGHKVPSTLQTQKPLETNQYGITDLNYKWSYGGPTGPDNWPKYFPQCGGKRQSPINIQTTDLHHVTWLPTFEFINYDKLSGDAMQPAFLHLRNNGHTASMSIDDEIYLRGSNLGELFRAVEIHFHWGPDNHMGSEHVLDDLHHPLEVHIVHYNTKYKTLSEAMPHPDGLAVIGVFADISEEKNHAFELVATALDQVTEYNQKTIVSGLRPIDMLPNDTSKYYHYAGSLTTPPCYESVSWYVMHEGITVTQDQINRLRHLREHVEENHGPHEPLPPTPVQEKPKVNITHSNTVQTAADTEHHSKNIGYIKYNYRPCQPLFGRKVYCSHPSLIKHKSRLPEFSVGDIAVSHHVSNLGDHDLSKASLENTEFHQSIGSSLSSHAHESHLLDSALTSHSQDGKFPSEKAGINFGGHHSKSGLMDVLNGHGGFLDKRTQSSLNDIFLKTYVPDFNRKLEEGDIYKIFGNIFLRQAQILNAQKKVTDRSKMIDTSLFAKPEIKEYSNLAHTMKKIETVKERKEKTHQSHLKEEHSNQKTHKPAKLQANMVHNSPSKNYNPLHRQKTSNRSFNLAADRLNTYSTRKSNSMAYTGFHFSMRKPVYQQQLNNKKLTNKFKKSKTHKENDRTRITKQNNREKLTQFNSVPHNGPESLAKKTRKNSKRPNKELKNKYIDLISESRLDSNATTNTQEAAIPRVEGSVGFGANQKPQVTLTSLGLEESAVFQESGSVGLSNLKSDTITETERRTTKSVPSKLNDVTHSQSTPVEVTAAPEPVTTSKPSITHEPVRTTLGNSKIRFPIHRKRNSTTIPIRDILHSYNDILSIPPDPVQSKGTKPYLPL